MLDRYIFSGKVCGEEDVVIVDISYCDLVRPLQGAKCALKNSGFLKHSFQIGN
jgi:hypothetical protein